MLNKCLIKKILIMIIKIMDADGEDRPEEIKDLVKQTFLSEIQLLQPIELKDLKVLYLSFVI